jgi:hypothetical protein
MGSANGGEKTMSRRIRAVNVLLFKVFQHLGVVSDELGVCFNNRNLEKFRQGWERPRHNKTYYARVLVGIVRCICAIADGNLGEGNRRIGKGKVGLFPLRSYSSALRVLQSGLSLVM